MPIYKRTLVWTFMPWWISVLEIPIEHIKTQLQYSYTRMNDASFITEEEAEEK